MEFIPVDFESALSHINDIPVANASVEVTTQLVKRKMSVTGWIGLGLANLGLEVYAGLFAYQEGCIAITVIPGIGVFSGAACVIALISSMAFVAGMSMAAGEGVSGIFNHDGVQVNTRSLLRRDGSELPFDADFYKYGHHANLTHYHSKWRSNGLKTDLVDLSGAAYYMIGDSMFGTNVTNVYQTYNGHNMYVQHGLNASRMYVPYYNKYANLTKRSWEAVGTVDQYGNGFNDEELSGTDGFKGQWCHPYGNSETISPQNDWSTMNGLVNDVTGGGATGHYNLWNFDVVDMNHNEEEVCDIEIEGESSGFGDNAEWSEEGLCEAPRP